MEKITPINRSPKYGREARGLLTEEELAQKQEDQYEEDQNYQTRIPQYGKVSRNIEEGREIEYRIKDWMAVSMILLAACIDLAQLGLALVGVGDVGGDSLISFGADMIFIIWFKVLGIPFISSKGSKRFFMTMAQGLLEAIPIIQVLPWLTFTIIFNVWTVRQEDKGGAMGKVVSIGRTVQSNTPTKRAA
jgi:hypothetical protein